MPLALTLLALAACPLQDDPDGNPSSSTARAQTVSAGQTLQAGPGAAGVVAGSFGLGAPGACSGLAPERLATGLAPEGDTPTEVVFTPDGSRYLIAHRDTGNVLSFDAASGQFLAEIPVSGSPQGIAIRGDGTLAVTANFGTDSASVIDLTAGIETGVVPVGTLPGGVRITPDGTRAVVANYGSGDLSVIDIASQTETARIGPLGYSSSVSFAPEPAAATFSIGPFAVVDVQTVLVPELFDSNLAFVDLTSSSIVSVPCDASPRGLTVVPGLGRAFVTHSGSTRRISIVDTVSRSIVGTVATSVDLTGPIAVDPAGNLAVVAIQNACIVVDLTSGSASPSINTASVNQLLTTADGLHALGVGFNGSLISFASQSLVKNLNTVVSTAFGAVSPTGPQAVMVATTFGEDAVRVNTAGAAGFLESVVPSGAPPEADKSRRAAVTPDGSRAVVTNILSDTASVVDLASGDVLAVLDVGNRPSDVAITPDGTRAVVCNLDSTFASVLDLVALTSTPVPISTRGAEVEIAPSGQYAYVSVISGGDGVWRIDLNTLGTAGPKLPTGEMGGVGYAYSQTSGLTLSPDGTRLVACNSFDDSITVIDAVGWSVLGSVAVGDFPTRATFAPTGNLVYVSNRDGDDVSQVRLQPQLVELQKIPVGDAPFVSAFGNANNRLAVLVTGSTAPAVVVLDTISGTTVATVPLPHAPSGIVHDPASDRWIVASGTWSVTFGSTFEIGQSGELTAIDANSLGLLGQSELGIPPSDLAFAGGRFAAPSPFDPGLATGAFPAGLSVDGLDLSLSAGGAQSFCIDAGPSQAGNLYLVLGSITGTAPAFVVDAIPIPLVIDAYFFQNLTQAGQGAFVGTLGVLDAAGRGSASLVVPAGFQPSLAGVTLFHAAVAADPVFGSAKFASNATSLLLGS